MLDYAFKNRPSTFASHFMLQSAFTCQSIPYSALETAPLRLLVKSVLFGYKTASLLLLALLSFLSFEEKNFKKKV